VTEIRKWRERAAKLRADAQAQDDAGLLRAAQDYELMAEHEERLLTKFGNRPKAA
jgi:hypothetical protein